jgi:hypothetical protein
MILHFILEFIAYNVGYFFIRIITGGKYPKEYLENGGSIGVEVVGVLVSVIILVIAFYFIF